MASIHDEIRVFDQRLPIIPGVPFPLNPVSF